MTNQEIETNRIVVIEVNAQGALAAVNGANKRISWDALDEAARQDDTDLAALYQELRKQARRMVEDNRELPIRYSVGQDESHVWWRASFRDVAGQWGWIPRRADEGGTHHKEWMAREEAKERAERLRKMGFTVREN